MNDQSSMLQNNCSTDGTQPVHSSLECELLKLREKNAVLKANISTLFKTAQNEIQRKDKRIADLQAELDDLIFKRSNRKLKTEQK